MKIDADYRKAMRLIDSLRDSRDLDGLEKFADEIETKWYPMKKINYFDLTLHVCDLFRSIDFNDYDRQVSLEQRYANSALRKSEKIPLDVELNLLLHVREDIEYLKGQVKGEAWSKQRSNKADVLFRAWHRLEMEIDRDFDFSDLPAENIAPPEGTSARSGIAPKHIKDQKLRTEYEAAIAQREQKAKIYNRQYKLRQLDELFSPKAEQYIISAYSRPPFAMEELKRLLESYIDDKATKLRILDAVKKRKC